ncbi:hypothetical protein ACSSS7_004447 [Eimeria intestinalis]
MSVSLLQQGSPYAAAAAAAAGGGGGGGAVCEGQQPQRQQQQQQQQQAKHQQRSRPSWTLLLFPMHTLGCIDSSSSSRSQCCSYEFPRISLSFVFCSSQQQATSSSSSKQQQQQQQQQVAPWCWLPGEGDVELEDQVALLSWLLADRHPCSSKQPQQTAAASADRANTNTFCYKSMQQPPCGSSSSTNSNSNSTNNNSSSNNSSSISSNKNSSSSRRRRKRRIGCIPSPGTIFLNLGETISSTFTCRVRLSRVMTGTVNPVKAFINGRGTR